MTVISAQVLGGAKAIEDLRAMSKKIRGAIVTKAIRAGAKPQQRATKRGVRRASGLMARSMMVKVKSHRGGVLAVIGPRNKTVDGKNPNKYAHIVEGGAKPHVIPQGVVTLPSGETLAMKNIQHPGFRASRGMQRSAKMSEGSALTEFTRVLTQEIAIAAGPPIYKPKGGPAKAPDLRFRDAQGRFAKAAEIK